MNKSDIITIIIKRRCPSSKCVWILIDKVWVNAVKMPMKAKPVAQTNCQHWATSTSNPPQIYHSVHTVLMTRNVWINHQQWEIPPRQKASRMQGCPPPFPCSGAKEKCLQAFLTRNTFLLFFSFKIIAGETFSAPEMRNEALLWTSCRAQTAKCPSTSLTTVPSQRQSHRETMSGHTWAPTPLPIIQGFFSLSNAYTIGPLSGSHSYGLIPNGSSSGLPNLLSPLRLPHLLTESSSHHGPWDTSRQQAAQRASSLRAESHMVQKSTGTDISTLPP